MPKHGYDIINCEELIYVEMKNKHNTMNSSSAKSTLIKMQNTLISCPGAICLLVEVISKKSQNERWIATIDGQKIQNEQIRKVSIDKFYALVTGDAFAFKKLCRVLPSVVDDVVKSLELSESFITNTAIAELQAIDLNLLNSVYLLSFKTYEGFHDFSI